MLIGKKIGKKSGALNHSFLAIGALAVGSAIVGCDDKSTPDNGSGPRSANAAEAPAGAATLTGANVGSDPLANVENKTTIRQYPDETKLDPPKPAQLITGFAVQVRESPGGDVLASTQTSAPVREVARDARGNYYLIVFADPKDPTKELAGWVYRGALEDNAWATGATSTPRQSSSQSKGKTASGASSEAKLSCAKGTSHIRTSLDFCAKTCEDDRGCNKDLGEICDGLGFKVSDKSGQVSNTNFCIASASPTANGAHGPQHGSSAPLQDMNRNYDPKDPAKVLDNDHAK